MNASNPECNGPFLIYSIPDYVGVDTRTEYKGFYIILPIDSRFAEMDEEVNWYSAKVVGAKQILFQIPAWPYALWPKGQASAFLYTAIANEVADNIKKSMNAAHAVFDDADTSVLESRKWRYYLLDFSNVKGIGELSSKVLSDDAGDQEVLEFDLITVPRRWETDQSGNVRVTEEEEFLGFKVAHVDTDGGRKVQRKGAQKSKLAQKRANKRTNMSQAGI